MFEEDSVQLISSRSLPKRNRRARSYNGDQHFQFSDSELGGHDNNDASEETTVFSDSLYGDSLPSMRAQLAATQMQRKRKTGDLANSVKKERESLLDKTVDGEGIGTVIEGSLKKAKEDDTHGQYKSLGGLIVPKKKVKKESMMKL